jgi:hypothetical protein
MIGEPRQTAGPSSCHPRPLAIGLPDPAHFDPAHFIETQDHVWPARSRDPAGPRNYTEGFGDLIPISIFRAHRYPIVKLAIKKSDRKS